jgi:hypothetical protein
VQNPFASDEGKATIARRLPGVPPETIEDYVTDAWAKATMVAPCIASDTFPDAEHPEKAAQATAILRSIILRWAENKSGAVTAKVAGPYQLSLDQRPTRGFSLLPAEEVDLRKLCAKGSTPWSFDTTPDDFRPNWPLQGACINGYATGPAGEWSPDAPELDV